MVNKSYCKFTKFFSQIIFLKVLLFAFSYVLFNPPWIDFLLYFEVGIHIFLIKWSACLYTVCHACSVLKEFPWYMKMFLQFLFCGIALFVCPPSDNHIFSSVHLYNEYWYLQICYSLSVPRPFLDFCISIN